MPAVLGRVWGWINPGNLYRPWAANPKCQKPLVVEGQEQKQTRSSWTLRGVTSWVWGGWRNQSDQKAPEEFWEAQEELHKPFKIEDLKAEMTLTPPPPPPPQSAPRWWGRMLPSGFRLWPRSADTSELRQRSKWDQDSEISDYDTPPPSPTPLSQDSSKFRFFALSWSGEILPEHYEICFNFLRHLFDLLVVGFLWTVSPPARFILDVMGVQGALKLWLHGMAMFLVTSVGMAGLLWLVQEYLPHFALVYGIIQALVISVSVRQSVILGTGDEDEGGKEEDENMEETEDEWEQDQTSDNKRMNAS